MMESEIIDPTGDSEGSINEDSEKNNEEQEAELLRLDAEISRAVRALDHWIFRLQCAGDDREGKA